MSLRAWLALACVGVLACSSTSEPKAAEPAPPATSSTATPPAPAAEQTAPADKPLSAGELEQLVAPIALYPDDLIAQILMASTYPLEIVEAARWAKEPANAKLKGKALDDALAKQEWDPSVKSIVPFPSVLANMDEKLDWTQKLGDAFLAQQKDTMDAIQRLRAKADAAGNLQSNDKQTVTKEAPPAGSTSTQEVIIIQPTNPEVVYVPTYQPTVVYGAWPYPAYPPYYWPPPPGAVFAAGFFWGTAFAVSASYFGWGHCGWHGGDVDINVNNSTNISNDFKKKREEARGERGDRERGDRGDRERGDRGDRGGGNEKWKHDSSHRKGVNYKDASTREKFGKGQARDAQARESFRGREGGAGAGARPSAGTRDLGAAGARDRAAAGDRGAAGTRDRAGAGAGDRSRGGAFDRPSGGSSARASSSRGNRSMSSSGSRGGGGRGGGGRGGGGRRR